MVTAIDKTLDSIKRFEAQNASMSEENLIENALPGTATSHAPCYKTYRESMKVLIKQWKKKVATLKAANDPNPEMNATKAMQQVFKNVQNALDKCVRMPLHKIKTPRPGDKFGF
jgi:hypothetical protein